MQSTSESWDCSNEKPSTVSEVQQKRKQSWWICLLWRWRLEWFSKLSKVIKMILVLFYGQGCIERGFNVNKDMLQQNLEGMLLISQKMISSDLSPQSITITKGMRDSARKACSRQRIDLAERKEKEASDARMRKAEALMKDIN